MAIIVQAVTTTTPIDANVFANTYLILPDVFVTSSTNAVDGDDANGSKTILVHGGLVAEADAIRLGYLHRLVRAITKCIFCPLAVCFRNKGA